MNLPRNHASSFLVLALRLVLGGTFLWAGLVKIPEPGLFSQTVRAYDVLPLPVINPFAIVVPWIEVVSGICLILGIWTRSSALTAIFLLFCFGVALGVNLYRGADLSCECFGMDGTSSTLRHAFLRDIFLVSIGLILIREGSSSHYNLSSFNTS